MFYIYNIVVRWANGDLEGFGSSGLDEGEAYRRAVAKASAKARDLRITFSVLDQDDYRALSVDDQDEIQTHWDMQTL